MSFRPLPATCAGLLAAMVAVAPAQAQTRVSKDVLPATAPAAPTPAIPTRPPTVPAPDMAPPAAATAPAAPAAPSAAMQTAMAPASGAAVPAGVAVPPRAPGVGEPPEAMFTDPKIAAVASASNFSEIEPSQIALERAQTPALREFARLMIDHHTRLEQHVRALLERKGVRPEDNALSLQLKRNGPPTLQMLRSKSGRDFDAAYTLQQINSHQTTLHTLDTSLIPSAADPEMKTMLRDTVRPLVADHLARIMAIHHQMLGMPPAPAAGR